MQHSSDVATSSEITNTLPIRLILILHYMIFNTKMRQNFQHAAAIWNTEIVENI